MKLVAWNLGHQCREDALSHAFLPAVRTLAPDLLSLNEYAHGQSRAQLVADLSDVGLKHVLVSERLNDNNQVLIASRYQLVQGEVLGPQSKNQGGESNFLHVRVPSHNFEFVGVRAPAYAGEDLRVYWSGLMQAIRQCAGRRIVFMGDFNTDPDRPRRANAKHLRALRDEGWSVPSPEGEWSYISPKSAGTRIDHAVASMHLRIERAEYITSLGGVELASSRKANRVSDHAPLVVHLAESSRGKLGSDSN